MTVESAFVVKLGKVIGLEILLKVLQGNALGGH